jgi:acyl-[acyl-carrier-protein]-phospholipid O-acyltransferase / long-chain-fatty-acid--[acyl-carrier-protein] ligase
MELETIHLENLKYSLFSKRRFLPLFLASFFGAFNDNLLRSGLVVLIAYSADQGIVLPTKPEILVTICSALLILPLLFFSSITGTLADKFEKSRLVIFAKLAEVAIMCGAFYGFATHNIYLLMLLLFISGTHTAFYGPIKYSLLPEHLPAGELMAANGFMASGGYLAVLFGMITGGWLALMQMNYIGMTAVGIACGGLLASMFIPRSVAAHPAAVIDFNVWKGARTMVAYIFSVDRTILHTILALSWFLLVGSVYMAQFANYAHSVVHANNQVYILFLTVFSIGLAIGSVACDTLLKGEISTRLIPWAALGISMFTYLMVWATPTASHENLIDVSTFLQVPMHWVLLAFMLLVAISGGLYMVPLYTVLQSRADEQYRSRIMAASNFSDSIFMTTAAIISALLLMLGVGILQLFLIVATFNLGAAAYARRLGA